MSGKEGVIAIKQGEGTGEATQSGSDPSITTNNHGSECKMVRM